MGDHSRVLSFLTGQVLGILFSSLCFLIFGAVLLVYDTLVFAVFIAGTLAYGAWIATFLNRRKVLRIAGRDDSAILFKLPCAVGG